MARRRLRRLVTRGIVSDRRGELRTLIVNISVCAASWAIAESLPSMRDGVYGYRGVPMFIAQILITGLQLAGPVLLGAALLIGAASEVAGADALRPVSRTLVATVLGLWGFVLLLSFLELADANPLVWVPVVVITGLPIVAAIVIALANRKLRPGHCPYCDYDLAGLDSDVCPECGKRTRRHGLCVRCKYPVGGFAVCPACGNPTGLRA